MYLKNFLSALDIGITYSYLSVKTAGSEKCGVKNVRSVCSSNNNYAFIFAEAVHFYKHLVESLLTFIVAAAHTCASLSADSINLINEDD